VNVNAGDIAIRTARGPFTLRLRDGRLRRGGLVPFPSDTLTLVDEPRDTVYVTQPRFFGFRTIDMTHLNTRFVLRFKGFAWNPRFGPNPPSHGLSLAPDRPELWVLDAPNSAVHLFDVSEVPVRPPRAIANIRFSKPLSGDERECVADCGRLGSLQHSADGRFVYVGDAGDVISTRTREVATNLEALHNSRVMLQVDWQGGKPVFPLLHR
jgi:hypothetical protein